MQGRFYGMRRADAVASAERLLDTLDLGALRLRKVSSLSGGQKRRLDIALGLIHAPGLLFLDEPSTGMDPQNRANLWEHILRVRAEHGTTIVLTTHYLDEADAMAERVVVIDHGRIIADDSPSTLKVKQAGDRLTVVVPPDAGRDDAAQLATVGTGPEEQPDPAARQPSRHDPRGGRGARDAGRAGAPGRSRGRRRRRRRPHRPRSTTSSSTSPAAACAKEKPHDHRDRPGRHGRAQRHRQRLVAGDADDRPRPVLADLLAAPAAGVPRPVRPAAVRARRGPACSAGRRCSGSCPASSS